jgi:hypothetical protein
MNISWPHTHCLRYCRLQSGMSKVTGIISGSKRDKHFIGKFKISKSSLQNICNVNILKSGVIMVQVIVRHCHSEQWEKQFIYTYVHAWLCGLIHMNLCICVCTCSLVFSLLKL